MDSGCRLQVAGFRGVTANDRLGSSASVFFNLQFIVYSLRLHFASNFEVPASDFLIYSLLFIVYGCIWLRISNFLLRI